MTLRKESLFANEIIRDSESPNKTWDGLADRIREIDPDGLRSYALLQEVNRLPSTRSGTPDRTIDRINIHHINTCPGCHECDNHLMEFYSGCSTCERTGHKKMLNYIHETGEYICDHCLEEKKGKETT